MNNYLQEILEKKIKKSIKKVKKYDFEKLYSKNPDPEILHKYRVFIRKILSILEEFVNEIRFDLNLIYELRHVFRKAGRVRDYDILIENYNKFTNELKETKNIKDLELDFINNEFYKILLKKRNKYLKNFIEWIESKNFKNFNNKLEKLEKDIKFKNFYISDTEKDSIIYLIQSKFYKLLSHSYWKIDIYDIKALHHLRRQIKRTRYYMEFFKKFYKKNDEYKNIINSLKELQDLTGSVVDIFIFREEFQNFTDKNLSEFEKNNDLELNILSKIDLWLQEKESTSFDKWNQKKMEFYNNKNNFIEIIQNNCNLDISKAETID